METNDVIIIGAGFAGLSAGIYAQMNGYRTQIFEMHTLPGGLCTAWKRKGYTIDGCVHWLVGSSPGSGLYRYWEEVGIAARHDFIYMDRYARFEGTDGRTLTLWSDVDRLEAELLAFSPQDAEPIGEFIKGIRMGLAFDPPSESDPLLKRLAKTARMGLLMATKGREMQRWMGTTAEAFTARFKDPMLGGALRDMWMPEFSMLFMLFTFAYLHKKSAGYPIGGSLPMSQTLAQRYRDLGGTLHINSRVDQILVENDRAVGVRLADGSEHRAARVISAADGHTTIFKLLDGAYVDEEVRTPYESWQPFPALLYVGIGVNRTFEDEPQAISGLTFALPAPVRIGNIERDKLEVHICNYDPTLAPEGKTTLIVMMEGDYDYWQALAQDRVAYDTKKDEVARTVVGLLEQRFPDLAAQVEMVDVATPLTFERYTGNWKGSFEGWLLTPQNSFTMMKPMRQTLPGLHNFYMCGHWVEPGGGLPTGVMSGRRLVQGLCKEDGRKFRTTVV